jgi:hypothetical protein
VIDDTEIANRFGYHPATYETVPMHENVRSTFAQVTVALLAFLPPGRETALVITALEEASMWANAAIARNLAPLG